MKKSVLWLVVFCALLFVGGLLLGFTFLNPLNYNDDILIILSSSLLVGSLIAFVLALFYTYRKEKK